jgi:hypothetical protein
MFILNAQLLTKLCSGLIIKNMRWILGIRSFAIYAHLINQIDLHCLADTQMMISPLAKPHLIYFANKYQSLVDPVDPHNRVPVVMPVNNDLTFVYSQSL